MSRDGSGQLPGNATEATPRAIEPLAAVAVAWVIGLIVGGWVGGIGVWLIVAAAAWALSVVLWWRGATVGVVLVIVCVGVAGLGSAWWSVRGPGRPIDLQRYVGPTGVLVRATGRIVSDPRIEAEPAEGMGRYMFAPPTTRFIVAVDSLRTDAGARPTWGGLLVSVPAVDLRPHRGDVVEVAGWMTVIREPSNPGEQAFAEQMRRMGVVGKLHCKSRGNITWQIMTEPSAIDRGHRAWVTARRKLSNGAARSLAVGMDEAEASADVMALLEAMLLGRRTAELDRLYETFRKTGLAHLLAISGLHVGILAAGAWVLVEVLTGRLRWAPIVAAVVVGAYLLVVPWRVPTMRAGAMVIVACIGLSRARSIRGMTLLSLMAIGLLVWRPGDLLDPGFQLSFGIVAGLMLFTRRVARALQPRSPIADGDRHAPTWGERLKRAGADYLAVSVVAWVIAMPIVAYHFQMVSPLAVLLGVAMFPVVAALLWLGFVKVAVGAVWAGAGAWLAGPVAKLAGGCIAVVERLAEAPGVWLEVPRPSGLWVVAALAVGSALLRGWFAGRRIAAAACIVIISVWLYSPRIAEAAGLRDDGAALTVHMLAVGDGSCFVLRSGDQTWLFDCGSSHFAEVGSYTVVPALVDLGIDHIDAIVISHADFDHFSGTLDVVDHLGVDRVITTPQVIAQAMEQVEMAWWGLPRATGATGYLMLQLGLRDVPVRTITAGWKTQLGDAQVEAIWPPSDARFERNNDESIVLRFTVGDHRLMMCGDIQADAMEIMLATDMDVAADVTDLPHHGSVPPPAVDWLRRVDPDVVLQSSGARRLLWDKWAGQLEGIARHITARHGMTTVRLYPDGRIEAQRYRAE